jgi:hypothetical protein
MFIVTPAHDALLQAPSGATFPGKTQYEPGNGVGCSLGISYSRSGNVPSLPPQNTLKRLVQIEGLEIQRIAGREHLNF